MLSKNRTLQDKRTLNQAGIFLAQVLLDKLNPTSDENTEDYVKRALLHVQTKVDQLKDKFFFVDNLVDNLDKPIVSAVFWMEVRREAVRVWAGQNKPFEINEGGEPTIEDILKNNGVVADVGDYANLVYGVEYDAENDQFVGDEDAVKNANKAINKMKSPSSDSLTATQIRDKYEEHLASITDFYPGPFGETESRHYTHESDAQDDMISEHKNVLSELEIEDPYLDTDVDKNGSNEQDESDQPEEIQSDSNNPNKLDDQPDSEPEADPFEQADEPEPMNPADVGFNL